MTDVRYLTVHVSAHVDGEPVQTRDVSVAIPPDYDAADLRALVRRTVEDTAFDHSETFNDRSPTRRAFIAAAARLRALRDTFDRMPRDGAFAAWAAELHARFEASNDAITAEWSEEPD